MGRGHIRFNNAKAGRPSGGWWNPFRTPYGDGAEVGVLWILARRAPALALAPSVA